MSVESSLQADVERFTGSTARDLPSFESTAEQLQRTLRERARVRRRRVRRAGVASLAALLLVALPIPHAEQGRIAWSTVFALARRAMFRVEVDRRGKTDREAEAAIREQVHEQGWKAREVRVHEREVSLHASDEAGHEIQLKRWQQDEREPLTLEPEPIDDTREPGMSDAQLRQKILGQLEARGLQAEVSVQGDHIRVHVLRTP